MTKDMFQSTVLLTIFGGISGAVMLWRAGALLINEWEILPTRNVFSQIIYFVLGVLLFVSALVCAQELWAIWFDHVLA